MAAVILTHGGVAAPAEAVDGAVAAAQAGVKHLAKSAVEAAIWATRVLEDDPRFNAGTGANLRLDGRTVEMDAGVMDHRGRVGAVAAIRGVRNPIVAARAVLDSPHSLLVGEGASRLARRLELSRSRRLPANAYDKFRRRLDRLRNDDLPRDMSHWRGGAWRRFWNFGDEPPHRLGGTGASANVGRAGGGACDTVGAVVMDSRGRFAATSSTGGTQYMLLGRVGDSAVVGAGFYAGPAGAVTSTGVGEEIMRRVLSWRVYEWMEAGISPQKACERGVALFPKHVSVGVLAVGRDGWGVSANRHMPAAGLEVIRGRSVRLSVPC